MVKSRPGASNTVFLSAGCVYSCGLASSAVDALKLGNRKFLQGAKRARLFRREDPETGPLAVVLASSDIGIAPESLFHTSPGELVVLQNAGPMIDEPTIEALTYYLGQTDTHTLVVLATAGSRITEFVLGRTPCPGPDARKEPFLASPRGAREQRHSGTVAKPDMVPTEALTKHYVGHLMSDLKRSLSEETQIHAALITSSRGELEWIQPD